MVGSGGGVFGEVDLDRLAIVGVEGGVGGEEGVEAHVEFVLLGGGLAAEVGECLGEADVARQFGGRQLIYPGVGQDVGSDPTGFDGWLRCGAEVGEQVASEQVGQPGVGFG